MRPLAALLLLAAAAPAVEAPLGPYARAGVPVLLASDAPVPVRVDGWTFRIEETGLVHPPRLPCTVEDGAGRELLRLAEPPAGVRLVGVIGDAPDLGAGAVRIRPEVLAPTHWRALDVFDAVLLTARVRGDEPWLPALFTWVRGGGVLAGPQAADLFPEGPGLGAVGPRLEELPPPRLSRRGNVRPDVYEEVAPPADASPALRSSRWVALGAAAAFAVQLVLAAAGLAGRRVLLAGLAAVALLGAVAGAARTRSDYSPLARGRIEVAWIGGGVERLRTYEVYVHAGPGAVAPEPGAATPLLFREHFAPWWGETGAGAPLGDGMVRIYADDQVLPGGAARLPEREEPPDLRLREAPARGRAEVRAGPRAAPRAAPGEPVLLRRIELIVQD